METKYGFSKMNISEFENWVSNLRVARTILTIQQHHTFAPNYSSFKKTNHFAMQKSMKDYHVIQNGWMDIAQHFSIFPDGAILTGRSLEYSPAGIKGANSSSICIETVGNFDKNQDVMSAEQKDSIVRVTAALCKRFGIPVTTDKILYHHWYNLSTGARNNGSGNNKSCPGSNFFGGNKVNDCESNFLPLVRNLASEAVSKTADILQYVCVTAATLNIRKQSTSNSEKVTEREPATYGSILRVFEIQNDWYRISNSEQHWVSSKYTIEVLRATVNTDGLNVRTGPGTNFSTTGTYMKGEEVFISNEKNGWCKISMQEKWVKKNYLNF